MAPRYRVTLTKEEREDLRLFQQRGKGQPEPYYILGHYSCLMSENKGKNGLLQKGRGSGDNATKS